ncbi:MAG: helix-turn-helix transcriptional regulator, partial [Bacteroidota bacterium]
MTENADQLRLILGLKLKTLRQEQGRPLKDVAEAAGVSISYLSEIEKGKKYPKPEKLIDLAAALGTSYDDLVSLRVEDQLRDIKTAIASPFLREFPFELFGVEP